VNLKELTIETLKEKGLNGLNNFDGDGCACAIEDLMPCDNPQADCIGCVLKTVKDCGDADCEWQGEDHFHEVEPMTPPTPSASGDGSERPKKPPLIPWPYLTYEEGKRVAPSLEPQVRALYNYVDALEVYVTKLEAERDAAIRAHK